MRSLSRILFVFYFALACFNVQARYFDNDEGIFYKLTIESGLSQNKINCILRDSHGFVWFGTGNGLNRFDGKNILVLENENESPFNLKGDEVFDLLEDKNGDIWIASYRGLYRYKYEDESIIHYSLGLGQQIRSVVYCIENEDENTFWVGTNAGLLLFDRGSGGVIEGYKNLTYQPYSLSDNLVMAICNAGDKLWIGTQRGINVFDKKLKIFERFKHDAKDKHSLSNDIVRKITQDEKGTIFIGTEFGGLSVFNNSTHQFDNFDTEDSDIPHNDVRDIYNLGNGKLWLATNGGGLSLFDTSTHEFINYQYDPSNINGLSNNSVYTVLEDYEGILWLGFYAAGVNYNISKINDFKLISHLPGNDNSICENNVRSLFLDSRDNLWIGTLGGLSFYNHNDQTYQSYLSDPSNDKSISFNTITSVLEDSKKNIWVGTYSGGLNLLKPTSNKFIHFKQKKFKPGSISDNNIYSIVEDGHNNVWVGTYAGLNLYDRTNSTWKHVLYGNVRDIEYIKDDKLHIAKGNTITIYNIATQKAEVYENDSLTGPIIVISTDKKGNKIWYGSQGGGFGYFDLNSKEFTNYTAKDGLPNDFVASIEPYGDNYLWLGTYKGLSLFNKENEKFVNFGMADGLHSLEFYPNSSLTLPDSSLAFGGTKGIVVFDPTDLISRKDSSKLRFVGFKIDGNNVEIGADGSPLQKSIQVTDKIVLRYSQNDFSFDFLDINFKNRGLGDFSYILENYMDSWRNIGDQNSVSFTNMDPGEYVLRVRKLGGQVLKGHQDEISMHIEIIPPFWMTWYFYLFVFLSFVVILYFYSKYTFISISHRNEIKLKNLEYEKHEEFNALRMKFFTYISHELRTPLSLIVDPLNRLLSRNEDESNLKYLKLIENNSDRMMKLVNQILDFRRLENDTLSLQVSKNNIVDVVTRIYTDFEETAINERINYRFDCQVDQSVEGWIDADKLEKITYNLLSNAFKFAKKEGEVTLALEQDSSVGKIKISIKDDGHGIKPEKLKNIFDFFYTDEKLARTYKGGVGIGLSYVKRLVDLHHGTITVKSELDKGTTFIVEIPIVADVYSSEEHGLKTSSNSERVVSQLQRVPKVDVTPPVHGPEIQLVLVVEDETDLRKYLAFLLGERFRIEQAVNGFDALEKLETIVPDLIVCDNVMPKMDGITFCNQLKSNEELSHVPFIFLSAWNSEDFKLKGLEVGADDYISKPFDSEMLLAKVTNIIEKRRKFREIAGKLLRVNPTDITIETSDERFILRAQEVIEKNMDNLEFTTKQFKDELSMSHSVVYRKIKTLTGLSSNEFIREYKIRRAAQIISQDKQLSVMEVSLMVGFNDQKYFSRCFKKIMGVSPSEYSLEKSSI